MISEKKERVDGSSGSSKSAATGRTKSCSTGALLRRWHFPSCPFFHRSQGHKEDSAQAGGCCRQQWVLESATAASINSIMSACLGRQRWVSTLCKYWLWFILILAAADLCAGQLTGDNSQAFHRLLSTYCSSSPVTPTHPPSLLSIFPNKPTVLPPPLSWKQENHSVMCQRGV